MNVPLEEDPSAQLDVWHEQLAALSARLNACRTLQEPAAASRLPIVGRPLAAIRRALHHFFSSWYDRPLLEQQNRFNEEIVRSVDELTNLLKRLQEEQARAKEEIDGLSTILSILTDQEKQRQQEEPKADQPEKTESDRIVPPLGTMREGAGFWDGPAHEGLLQAKDAILARLPGEEEEVYLRRFETDGAFDASRMQPYCFPDGRVLELGCGIGRILKHIRAHERWGIDVSQGMLEWGALYLQGQEGIHLVQTDGFGLNGVPDDYFDLVYSLIVLQHVNKRAGFNYLCETRRVLKPGGRFVLEFMNLLSEKGFAGFQDVLQTDYPLDFYTPEEVQFKLTRAGLKLDELYTTEEHLFAIGRRP